jgi:Tfp pilus assembly protein PilF
LRASASEHFEYRYWFAKCSEALALKYLDAFLAQSPGSYRVHQLKAEYFLAVNDEEQAIREYGQAISMKPDAVQLHADLGNLFMVHHEYRRAIVEYQAELRANPYSLQALERIGQAYVELHETGNAINYLDRATAIDPHAFEALRALGQVSYQRAAYQEAAARFHAAWAAKPEGDSTVAYQLVQTYRKLGDKAEMQRWSAELQRQLARDLAKAQQNLSTTAPSHITQ